MATQFEIPAPPPPRAAEPRLLAGPPAPLDELKTRIVRRELARAVGADPLEARALLLSQIGGIGERPRGPDGEAALQDRPLQQTRVQIQELIAQTDRDFVQLRARGQNLADSWTGLKERGHTDARVYEIQHYAEQLTRSVRGN